MFNHTVSSKNYCLTIKSVKNTQSPYELFDTLTGIVYSDLEENSGLQNSGDLNIEDVAKMVMNPEDYESGLYSIGSDFCAHPVKGEQSMIYLTLARKEEYFGKYQNDEAEALYKKEIEIYENWVNGSVYTFELESIEVIGGENYYSRPTLSPRHYYGQNFVKNGMIDDLPQELHQIVKDWVTRNVK